MENTEQLKSILPFLPPLILHSSSLSWPPPVIEALKALSKGPAHSNVKSGEVLFLAISDIHNSLSIFNLMSSFTSNGYSLFFDDLMSRADATRWFEEVLPRLADLLLRFPSLLENHYNQKVLTGVQTGLRLLKSQHQGIVLLSQELIGALLTCSFFCLFPTNNRGAKHLPTINFDQLFACLYETYDAKIESKIKCITHYLERICSSMPIGNVSFERKVLPFDNNPYTVTYPDEEFWNRSNIPLCRFEVYSSGYIEDQPYEALEVDFANRYLGGGALHRGCVQEEIRFMINPELIAGMLFLPAMVENEAIEIVGVERFSNYSGYANSFRFCGDYVDKKGFDSNKRRKTRIIAIDALCHPGKGQYETQSVIREINKAFCGFLDMNRVSENFNVGPTEYMVCDDNEIGIATGNWGCGVFGGDPEIKAIIQWLAASQALRPFILYYTFGLKSVQKLDKVSEWIISHKWSVGELWNMMMEYIIQRRNGDTKLGFFGWLVPSLYDRDDVMLDVIHS